MFLPRSITHQTIIDDTLMGIPRQEKPKGIIVLGGAGSGKSTVAETLMRTLGESYVNINSDNLQDKLVEKKLMESSAQPSEKLVHELHRKLHSEAVGIRQACFHKAALRCNNIILETVGCSSWSIQHDINILLAKGYDIELHLIDADEDIAIHRTSQRNKKQHRQVHLRYSKKSNRRAKATWKELKRLNHGKISTHRWNTNGSTALLDDQDEIVKIFTNLDSELKTLRNEKFEQLDDSLKTQSCVKDHMDNLQQLHDLSYQDNSEEMLMAIASDMIYFPELYFDKIDKLDALFKLVDKSDLEVYYTSISRYGPTKSHGGVIVGSPKLEKGVSLAAAGDPRRGTITLPPNFKLRLLAILNENKEKGWDKVTPQLGAREIILQQLGKNEEKFDAYALRLLITNCAKSELDYFNHKILFSNKFNKFALWTKPRSMLQDKDSTRFNTQYPTYLKEQTQWFLRPFGHLHHWLTRKTAIRHQANVATSNVLTRWLIMESRKKQVDQKRTLAPGSSAWSFGGLAIENKKGNCNTISSFLLGVTPTTASIFNIGCRKGKQVSLPKVKTDPIQTENPLRDPRTGNRYDTMLKEAHLAKMIVHNPEPYKDAILKVNKFICNYLDRQNSESCLEHMRKTVKESFNELEDSQNVVEFLKQKLESEEPKDLYRCILFHKIFFENIYSKYKRIFNLSDHYFYKRMRPSFLFSNKSRGQVKERGKLEYNNSIGGFRHNNNQLSPLRLNTEGSSFNTGHTQTPANIKTTFNGLGERERDPDNILFNNTISNHDFRAKVICEDGVFFGGTSGTVTTTVPVIFREILADDPALQDNYIMAQIAALSYAGHHSMLETLLPLHYMGYDCPIRFRKLQFTNPDSFYSNVMNQRFKEHIKTTETGNPPVTIKAQYEDQLARDLTTLKQKPQPAFDLTTCTEQIKTRMTDVDFKDHNILIILQNKDSYSALPDMTKTAIENAVKYLLQRFKSSDHKTGIKSTLTFIGELVNDANNNVVKIKELTAKWATKGKWRDTSCFASREYFAKIICGAADLITSTDQSAPECPGRNPFRDISNTALDAHHSKLSHVFRDHQEWNTPQTDPDLGQILISS